MGIGFQWIVGAVCILLASPPGSPSTPNQSKQETDGLTARQILDRMADVYASCKTYQDQGEVSTKFDLQGAKMKDTKPFKTAFVRPDRFRFEYSEQFMFKGDRYIIWRGGEQVKTWWSIEPGVQKAKSLGMAIAGATGVSSGSAHTIPALLMKDEVGGRRITDLTKVKRLKDKSWKKRPCFRVKGKFANSPTTVWIEKETFLILRIEQQSEAENVNYVETTVYNPVVNEDVSDGSLKFDPPSEEK